MLDDVTNEAICLLEMKQIDINRVGEERDRLRIELDTEQKRAADATEQNRNELSDLRSELEGDFEARAAVLNAIVAELEMKCQEVDEANARLTLLVSDLTTRNRGLEEKVQI